MNDRNKELDKLLAGEDQRWEKWMKVGAAIVVVLVLATLAIAMLSQ